MHWAILAGGAIFVFVGFTKHHPAEDLVYIGIGCFLGIAARILQAEMFHRDRNKEQNTLR